jgi:hypothetical protein
MITSRPHVDVWLCLTLNANGIYQNFGKNFPVSACMKIRLAVLELFRTEMHTNRRGEGNGHISTAELPHLRAGRANLLRERAQIVHKMGTWKEKNKV